MFSNKYIFMFLFFSIFISFVCGVKYEKIKRHRQEILIFANIMGDEIVNTNEIIDLFGEKNIELIKGDYNSSMLISIGCSEWLNYLSGFEETDLLSFYRGIDLAVKKVDFDKKNKCFNNILNLKNQIND